MSDIKCPFCQQELQDVGCGLTCLNCKKDGLNGDPDLWQELIRTKELLEIEDAEHSMCHTQMLKTTEKLERTRKALDVAVDALNTIKGKHDPRCAVYHIDEKTAYDALEQITALEQKDAK